MSFLKRIGIIPATVALGFSLGCTAEIDVAPPPADAVWIDVRTAQEYKEGHLQQAALIPYDVIAKEIATLELAKDAPIYLYCRSGNRAGKAKLALEAQNYSNITNVGSLEKARSLASRAE
jgi:phage shock protein E